MKTGQSLIELLLVMGLMAILLPAILTGLVASSEGKSQDSRRLEATALVREAEEAVRIIRKRDWTELDDGTFFPDRSGSTWILSPGSESFDGFERQIVLSPVMRDPINGAIDSTGILDPSTRQITTTVSWTSPRNTSVESIQYLQRHLKNSSWLQTTDIDFNLGSHDGTQTSRIGIPSVVELILSGNGGNWLNPNIFSFDNSGNGGGNDIFIEGDYAYLATDDNGGSNPELTILDISDPTSPSIVGGIDLNTDVKGVMIQGNFAYLATTSNTQELIIVNISNKSAPSFAGSLNLGAKQDATMVYIDGLFAYVTKKRGGGSSRELYIVQVLNPSNPQEEGSFETNANINSIYVSGNYAYLASANNTGELTVVDISSKSNPIPAGSYDTPSSGLDANDVFVVGTNVYLVTKKSTGHEFFIIDTSSLSILGSYEVNETINGVYVSGNKAYLAATNINNKSFLVLDITDPENIFEIGSANLGIEGNDIFVQEDSAFVVSDKNSSELFILQSGPAGIFESSTFDAGSEVAFNNISFTLNEPGPSDIKIQIAVNNDGLTWNYVGPDNTYLSYYEMSDAIPLQSTNGQYIRYKAFFTSDEFSVPELLDVSINYSP